MIQALIIYIILILIGAFLNRNKNDFDQHMITYMIVMILFFVVLIAVNIGAY